MRIKIIGNIFLAGWLSVCSFQAVASTVENWWPEQKKPDYILKCTLSRYNDIREMNLAQSLCGLAAQAVNEGTGREGVWIETRVEDYELYYKAWRKRLKVRESGSFDTWSLVKRFKGTGYVKGYVLYDCTRKDNSINAATVQAGILKGVLIDKTQEEDALRLGLTKLYDACKVNLDEGWFNQYKSELNNRLIVLANPVAGNNRDYAIAHKAMVYYGVSPLLHSILEWVRPLSPVIGWNSGPEFQHIEPCSRWGLINTASDWCMNLPMLSIRGNEKVVKLKSVNPKKIAANENAVYHSFVMSDGDNMQWTFGGFVNSPDYWNNMYNGDIPMSFTSCVVNLSMAAPDVLHVLAESQPKNVSVVEYGGGYYYPDLFASKRQNADELLREFARIVNVHMKKTGVKTFGFICHKVDSDDALRAYRIFAEELEDVAGMIAVQYVPYNGGHGRVFWVKDRENNDIPVLSAKTQIWANLNTEGSGNPSRVAEAINRDVEVCETEGPVLGWTIVHAWSRFGKNGDTVVDVAANGKKGVRGVTPVYWCKQLLNKKVKVVPVEELLWRLRMKNDEKSVSKEEMVFSK